jgi:hypothetical protein
MNNKIQKYRDELEKIDAKMAALKERGKALEQKIREAETLEICALMRSENLTMSELISLARSKKENQGLPFIMDKQADEADADIERDVNADLKMHKNAEQKMYKGGFGESAQTT